MFKAAAAQQKHACLLKQDKTFCGRRSKSKLKNQANQCQFIPKCIVSNIIVTENIFVDQYIFIITFYKRQLHYFLYKFI